MIIKTEREFLNSVCLAAEEYLRRAKPEILALTEQFYAGPRQEEWENFDLLLEGAAWLTEMLELVKNCNERPANWEAYEALAVGIHIKLEQLDKSVEMNQPTQIATIIETGLLPIFEEVAKTLGITIDTEMVRENQN